MYMYISTSNFPSVQGGIHVFVASTFLYNKEVARGWYKNVRKLTFVIGLLTNFICVNV